MSGDDNIAGNEIRIRGISLKVIQQLDEEAAKRKMSRNQLLKSLIESFIVMPELQSLDEKYASLIKKLMVVIEKNTEALNRVTENPKHNDLPDIVAGS